MDEFGGDMSLTDLGEKEKIGYQFLQKQFTKVKQISPDDKFVNYLQFLQRNYQQTRISSYLYMMLTVLALP